MPLSELWIMSSQFGTVRWKDSIIFMSKPRKKPLRTNRATIYHHHHFGDPVPAALFNAFADQNTQHQPRYGVAHNQLRRAAEDGRPEA